MVGKSVILLDTHVLVWWVNEETKKFSRKARQALEQHGKHGELLVSSISFFEITTLERRGRLRFKIPVIEWVANVRRLPEYRFEPVTDDIAERAGLFGDTFGGDPVDRLLAATALLRGVPLVTVDEELRETDLVRTIW